MNEANALEQAGRYKEARSRYELALQGVGANDPAFAAAAMLNNLGRINRHLGNYADAKQQYQRALTLVEKARGAESTDYASMLHNLAVLAFAQEEWGEAALQFQRSLEIRKKRLGENHPATAQSLSALAAVHASLEQFAEAKKLSMRALAIEEKALGGDDPQIAVTLSNLSAIHRGLGQSEKALEVSRRAEQIARQAYGERHPLACERANDMAVLYADLGRYAAAAGLLRRVLDAQVEKLGEDNLATATTIANLAAVCFHQKMRDESARLYGRSLDILERLGTRSAKLDSVLWNYAWVLRETGRNSEGATLEARTQTLLATRMRQSLSVVTGLNDLLMLRPLPVLTQDRWTSINEEGNRLREAGQCRESIPILMRARSMASAELGAKHRSIALPINNLAAAYLCLGQFTRAEQLFREALELLRDDRTALRAGVLNNLGLLLMRLPGMKGAEDVLNEALTLSTEVHGASHPATTIPVSSLGVLQIHAGKHERARELFRRSREILDGAGSDGLLTAAALNNLAVAHLYLREYAEARDLTARALDLRRRLLPASHPDIAQTLYNHAVALEKLGQRKSARTAFREAQTIRSTFASDNSLGLTVDVKMLDKK